MFQDQIPYFSGCIRDVTLSGRKLFLLSDSNRVHAASKCFRSVQPGYFFDNGFLAHEIGHVLGGGAGSREARIDVELSFRPMRDDGILVHMIGASTDFFLTLNAGQVCIHIPPC